MTPSHESIHVGKNFIYKQILYRKYRLKINLPWINNFSVETIHTAKDFNFEEDQIREQAS
jgi:hypothetical protein